MRWLVVTALKTAPCTTVELVPLMRGSAQALRMSQAATTLRGAEVMLRSTVMPRTTEAAATSAAKMMAAATTEMVTTTAETTASEVVSATTESTSMMSATHVATTAPSVTMTCWQI